MRSMTGFGKSQKINKNLELEIEVRSVNSRYLDLSVRLPNALSAFEMPVRERLKESVIRGKVTVYANLKKVTVSENGESLDYSKIQESYNQLKNVKELLNIDEDIKLSHLLSMGDLFEPDLENIDEAKLLSIILAALDQALDAFNKIACGIQGFQAIFQRLRLQHIRKSSKKLRTASQI